VVRVHIISISIVPKNEKIHLVNKKYNKNLPGAQMSITLFGPHCCFGLFIVESGSGPVLGQCGNGMHVTITNVCQQIGG